MCLLYEEKEHNADHEQTVQLHVFDYLKNSITNV